MNIQPQTDEQSYEYTTFPRVFVTYAWFKPLLVALLTAVFTLMISGITLLIVLLWLGDPGLMGEVLTNSTSAYFYSGPGLLIAAGGVAGFLPALALAERIVRGRPFSSYSSSRGGWNWAAFVKCLVLAAIVFGAEVVAMAFGMPDAGADGINKFTIIGAVICIVVVPLQAAAEEYIYRGLLMQAIGSWTKLPALAVVLSAIVFGISHSYDVLGITAVGIEGLGFAFLAWYSRGLEASSAAHAANNLSVFIFSGLGLGSGGSGGIEMVLISSGVMLLYCACIVLLDRKFNWFTSQGDGVTAFNEKYGPKAA